MRRVCPGIVSPSSRRPSVFFTGFDPAAHSVFVFSETGLVLLLAAKTRAGHRPIARPTRTRR